MPPDSSIVEKELLQAVANEASEVRTSLIDIPVYADSSLVASLWQKAIRRGHVDWAVSAAIELQRRDPDYVWRRIRVIALEEVSVVDPALVAQILAISGKRVLRARLGERQLLAYLTRELALSRKCRTPCDIASWLEPMGKGMEVQGPPARIRDLAEGNLEMVRRSAIVWRDAVPLSMRVDGRWTSSGKGSRHRREKFLDWVEAPPLLRFIVERGNSTYALNALCVPTAQLQALHSEPRVQSDPLPCSEELIRGIPAYAYCMYSAPGREALRLFVKNTKWADDERIRIRKEALNVLGNLIFYVEGDYCADMLEVTYGTEIEGESERTLLGRLGIQPQDIPSLMESARKSLSLLNSMRKIVAAMR
ncbi:MAG: hypothetical protein JSR63_06035 [Proteobacteria bacterium]|nr:hypothetical protein [Pseudomonadota bacterium]